MTSSRYVVRDDSNDVKLPARVPPMSLEDFVRAHQDDFTKADAHKP